MDETKRMKEKDFIERSFKVHGKKYDYSIAEYLNLKSEVAIICKEHGIFTIRADAHLSGRGCPQCSSAQREKTKRMSQKDFIERSLKVHGDKYDYSEAEYLNSRSKVSIICKEHGMFVIAALAHISGRGCPQCYYARIEKYRDKRMSQKDFIERSLKVHGDKYDYSEAEYFNSRSKVSIICKEHGEFHTRPKAFLNGGGCPFCRRMEEFVDDAKKIHGEKYDYSGAVLFSESEIETESEEKTINPSESKIDPKSKAKTIDPFEIEIINDGSNFSLYRDDKPIKISKKLFDLKKDVLITHTSRDLLDHMISEFDGQGGVKIDEKGKIVGPKKLFNSIALYSLQKDLIESEKEELSNQIEELIFSDPLLLSYTTPNISEQLARYAPLERWLGQSWDELYSLAKGMIEEPFWKDDNKLFKQTMSAECVLKVRDEYKSLSSEERTVVSYLRNMHDSPILFPMALVKGHCTVAEYARGIMASRDLFKSLNESITTDQQSSFYEKLSSQAREAFEYIKLFREGTPNKYIKDLIATAEGKYLEFKSTLRKNLVTNRKDVEISHACMKTIAAFMNTAGGKLLIGVSDNGDVRGIDEDLKNHDIFKRCLTDLIKNNLTIKALDFVEMTMYEFDQFNICEVDCRKANDLMFCKKNDGNEGAFIRTEAETVVLQPSQFEEYRKRNFKRL